MRWADKLIFLGDITYNVLDAKFVSSCFNWPSNAKPHLSLLFASNGVSSNTLDNVKPGWTVFPSLQVCPMRIHRKPIKNSKTPNTKESKLFLFLSAIHFMVTKWQQKKRWALCFSRNYWIFEREWKKEREKEKENHLLRLNLCYAAFILCGGEETNISKLTHGNLNFFHSSVRIVCYVHIYRDCFTMMI